MFELMLGIAKFDIATVAAVKADAPAPPPVVPLDVMPCAIQYSPAGKLTAALVAHNLTPDKKLDTAVEAKGNEALAAGAVDTVSCEVPVALGTLYEVKQDKLLDAAPIEPIIDMDKPTETDV